MTGRSQISKENWKVGETSREKLPLDKRSFWRYAICVEKVLGSNGPRVASWGHN